MNLDRVRRRFLRHVKKTDSCWLWRGKLNPRGYGIFSFAKTNVASRAAWMLFRGEIPAGRIVCHKCAVRRCVRPEHLYLGTYKQNGQDTSIHCGLKGEAAIEAWKQEHEKQRILREEILETVQATPIEELRAAWQKIDHGRGIPFPGD